MKGVPRHPYKPAVGRARELRREAPVPERLLWGALRSRRPGGYKFRRQHPIGPYVGDFYCAEARLVVELDGMSHVGQERKDTQRTAHLESLGVAVFRVTNDDVIEDIEAVAETILQVIERRIAQPRG